jgi:ornithine carbamoyltransferase
MKHFIDIKDISAKNLRSIIENSKKIKKRKSKNNREIFFKNKLMIILMEKPSLRTRMSLLSAAHSGGGRAITLRSDEIHLGSKGESIKDTAEILSRSGDLFVFRTADHHKIMEFKKYLSIPLICGLSNKSHALQAISDVQFIEENFEKNISKIAVSWVGDGNNNVINSLIEISTKLNFNLNIGCPKKYSPKESLNWAIKNGGKIKIFYNAKEAVKNTDVVITDKWISLHESNKNHKLKELKKFQVNFQLMSLAKKNAIFLHCLPASIGKEVTKKVLYGKQSRVYSQAENRISSVKSVIEYCLK